MPNLENVKQEKSFLIDDLYDFKKGMSYGSDGKPLPAGH
jgi:hypothetical protein